MKPYRFLTPALVEAELASRFYESSRPNLGREFLDELDETIQRVTANPRQPMTLTTHFITFNIPLENRASDLVGKVESMLAERGQPLRWAITQVNDANQIATVEAVVTTES